MSATNGGALRQPPRPESRPVAAGRAGVYPAIASALSPNSQIPRPAVKINPVTVQVVFALAFMTSLRALCLVNHNVEVRWPGCE